MRTLFAVPTTYVTLPKKVNILCPFNNFGYGYERCIGHFALNGIVARTLVVYVQ